MIPRGYLVGGAPLAGKTFWAESMLARRDGTVRVCTDDIAAERLRTVAHAEHPELFYAHGHDAESFYAEYDTPQKAVAGAVQQASALEDVIHAELQRRVSRGQLLIVEGVAMTPRLARRLQAEFRHHLPLQPLVFYDDDADRIRERIRARGLWRPAGDYTGRVLEHEVAYVLAFNDWFRAEAARYGCLLLHAETIGGIRFP